MPTQFSSSAALRFTEEELGGPCVENESYPVCSTNITSIVQGNGDRVGLLMINLGANDINVGLNSGVSSSQGILLTAQGGLISMTVRDDFTLPSREWFGRAIDAPSQVYVLEIVRFTNITGA